MNVTSTKTGDLNAVLTVNIKTEDYQEKVDKVLKDYRKNAKIPGFRPGMVPAGLIKKQYGKAVLIDEVNHLLQHAVTDHIRDNKLDILGNPLPVEQTDIDWDNQTEFAFDFEIGLSPEIELEISNKLKVPFYKIEADKDMVERYVTDYAKRYGTMTYPEAADADSIIKAELTEVDGDGKAVEGGATSTGTFMVESIEDKKATKALTGLKVGESTVLDINKAFKETFNTAQALNITKEQQEASTGNFKVKITELSKLEPAELNQDLFDKVFGEGAVKNEKEFKAKVKEDAEQMFVSESDRKFLEDIRDIVLEKNKFDLPDDFLKKWMLTSQERPVTAEEIEKEYPNMKDSMKWQLVENKTIKDNKIEVNQDELVEYTKQLVMRQMAQYGQQPPVEELDNIAKRVLENQEEGQRIADQLFSEKLLQHYKATVKLDEKKVSFDEFLKLVQKEK
jgi:trigger factor